MPSFQQLSYFMADQNTAVEQVCTLGAIREETGPALSEDEKARLVSSFLSLFMLRYCFSCLLDISYHNKDLIDRLFGL